MKRKVLFIILSLLPFLHSCDRSAEPVRGVWVPAPRFTSVLHTHENMLAFVKTVEEVGLNSIFLVAYADNKTIYKSKVLLENSGYQSLDATWMLSDWSDVYTSPSGDPVRDLIDEAHSRGIKVFFWYEYGFMGKGRPISSDDPILSRNPHWAGVNNEGAQTNYNGSDYYFNSYLPEVQAYIVGLIKEGLELYPDIDGVQGDDRLPAAPRNSGYDSYTIERYRSEHDGKCPPVDYNEEEWVEWRLGILNDFAERLYSEVKSVAPGALVSFAPNPYPWCEEKLMQDWPEWCRRGICDLLAVQCYRYSEEAYRSTLEAVIDYFQEANPRQQFVPGIILMEGSTAKMTPELLEKQININREHGVCGEIFFYNEALNNPSIRETLKKLYKR